MNPVQEEQKRQEDEYQFPYHYVAQMPSDGFRQHYVDTWGLNYVATMDFMLRRIEKLGVRSVIDIGCGDGRFTREIGLRFRELESVVGVDYSSRAIALADTLNAGLPNVAFAKSDIIAESTDRIFDCAVLMEVFEHIPLDDTQKFLHAVRNRICTNGTLLLTVPHANKPLEYKHFQHFTIETLTRELANEFEIEEIVPFEKGGFRRRLINRLLCNRFFVLNNPGLLNKLYRYQEKNLFHCASEDSCQRLFVQARVRR